MILLPMMMMLGVTLSQETELSVAEQLKLLKDELSTQKQITSELSTKLSDSNSEQLKLKTDISNLNFKTVSLYNTMSEAIDLLSDNLEELKLSVENEKDNTKNQLNQLFTSIDEISNDNEGDTSAG